ncbi:MAG: penicillin-binding protein [Actinobacteria bacterium]|nr:penicillin-binding protein [Actinomycetota bacterium]
MRDRIAIVFVVLVVVAVGGASVWFLLLRETGPTREEQAATIVERYRTAWEEGAWDDLASLTVAPEDVADTHEQAWAALEVADTSVTSGPVTVERGQADAELTVDLVLAGFGDWSYTTDLTMVRREGDWRVEWSPTTLHPQLEEGLAFARQVTEVPERAPILDRNGTPLAERREVIVAGVHPSRLDDPADVVQAFADHADVDPAQVQRLLDRDLNPDWFYPVTTLDPDADQRVVDLLKPVPGIVFQRQDRRAAVTAELEAHVVGEVAEITAEQLEQLGPAYEVGDLVGRNGLERVFEGQLTGEASGRIVLVAQERAPAPGPSASPTGDQEPLTEADVRDVVAEFGGEDPEPVRTTLDLEIQRALESAVSEVDGALGAVALDAPSGAIRAVVSRPLDEPFNRALDGLYPPGSTFKIVTMAAVLSELGPDTVVSCPAEVSIGGKRFTNAHDLALGDVDLETAFVESCNTAFVQLAEQLGEGDLGTWAQHFGFGADPELPLPASVSSYPEPADLAERAAAAIGQGRVQVSPLHMAAVAAAVATGGWNDPFLLDGNENPAAEGLPGEVEQLQGFMRGVVESGTGTAAQISGEPVHGKTGSAEFGETPGEDGQLPTHAWFVGYQGDLAFAFLVEGAGEGGEVAAPLAARFLQTLTP